MKTCLRLTCVGVFALAAALAQPQASLQATRGIPLRGEIKSTTQVMGLLTVELSGGASGLADTTDVNSDGSFEFRSVLPGIRTLRVIAGSGRVIHEEIVAVGGPQQLLTVRLPDQPGAERSAGSSISLRQLSHKVPRQAQKAYDMGQRAIAKGEPSAAAEFFRQAVTVDPEFVNAYNELGAAETMMGQLPEAAEQFQRAIDLVPEHPLALSNLSIVLAKMNRLHEAGAVARRALRVVPGASRMYYILACSLLAEHVESQEAIDDLQRAAAEIPKAHIVAAEALAKSGRRQEACRHLEEYLRTQTPDSAERLKLEARLAELRQ